MLHSFIVNSIKYFLLTGSDFFAVLITITLRAFYNINPSISCMKEKRTTSLFKKNGPSGYHTMSFTRKRRNYIRLSLKGKRNNLHWNTSRGKTLLSDLVLFILNSRLE